MLRSVPALAAALGVACIAVPLAHAQAEAAHRVVLTVEPWVEVRSSAAELRFEPDAGGAYPEVPVTVTYGTNHREPQTLWLVVDGDWDGFRLAVDTDERETLEWGEGGSLGRLHPVALGEPGSAVLVTGFRRAVASLPLRFRLVPARPGEAEPRTLTLAFRVVG
jgi:hypothetical protein